MRLRAEGIGFDDIRAGRQIGAVQPGDQIGAIEIKGIERLFNRDAHSVQHRPGSAVAEQDAGVELDKKWMIHRNRPPFVARLVMLAGERATMNHPRAHAFT